MGAKIAKFAMETRGRAKENNISVTVMNVEDMPLYMKYAGISYRRGEETRIHDPNDLQFFTLSRFMPPELMNYEGKAVVIDPDIFALSDIQELFNTKLGEASIAACKRGEAWDTSVMLLDCKKLKHWDIEKIFEGLKNGTEDYRVWMQLKNESPVPLSRDWNSLDLLTEETKMLHTTKRLTQPWRTGLPIDFTPGTIPKLFGLIPRFWVNHPSHYQPHPDKNIESLFFDLLRGTLESGVLTENEVRHAIETGEVRKDILEKI